MLPNNVSRSTAVGAILAPGGVSHAPRASGPRALWLGMEQDGTSFSLDADSENALGLDFLLAIGDDERLLRRLNELECAETVSTGGKQGTDAKWMLEPEKTVEVLKQFAKTR